MSPTPRVTVLLPCHQAERHLEEALASLTAQTWDDLEILALDDGSSDGTADILRSAASDDARIRVLGHDRNRGLIPTLNRGVREARGELLARMDADDVAEPDRVRAQVELLDARPEIGVVGTGARLVDDEGRPVGRRRPRATGPEGLALLARIATPLLHPSVTGRIEHFRAHPYGGPGHVLHVEDYDLFARMAASGVAFAALDAPLLRYRVGEGSVSRRHEATQVEHFVRTATAHLGAAFGEPQRPEVVRVAVNRIDAGTGPRELRSGLDLLDRLPAALGLPPDAPEVTAVLEQQRVDVLLQSVKRGSPGLKAAALRTALGRPRRLLSPASRAWLREKLAGR